MNATSTLCSISCSSNSKLPESGFCLLTVKTGEKLLIDNNQANRLVFLLSGEMRVCSMDESDYKFSPNSIILCARNYDHKLVATADSQLLVASFLSGYIFFEGETFRSVASEISKIKYKFTAVPINEAMESFVRSVVFYLSNNIDCDLIQNSKLEELFVVFRYFYTREQFLTLFYTLFNNSISFRSLVVNNAPNAKNVEMLAKLCGHSLSHFKLLFNQHFEETPYVWMQLQRAVEISCLLKDTAVPLKNIIKKFGFTSHGHFSLFCRKFLGDTPRALRRNSLHQPAVTIEQVKKNLEKSRTARPVKSAYDPSKPARKRGRPRKN